MIMDVQFTQDSKKTKVNSPVGVWRMVFFCAVFLSSLMAKAQLEPVGVEFSGRWLFDHAQAQEKPINSQQSYVARTVSEEEFNREAYFSLIPAQIAFMENYMAHISSHAWGKPVIAVINTLYNNVLEFRFPQEVGVPVPADKELYPSMMPVYSNLTLLSSDFMSMQCDYSYRNTQGEYIRGILTIYYKR